MVMGISQWPRILSQYGYGLGLDDVEDDVPSLDTVFHISGCKVQTFIPDFPFGPAVSGYCSVSGRFQLASWHPGDQFNKARQYFVLTQPETDELLPVERSIDHLLPEFDATNKQDIHLLVVTAEFDWSYYGLTLLMQPGGKYVRLGRFHAHPRYSIACQQGGMWTDWAVKDGGYADEVGWLLSGEIRDIEIV
jgi:hypothetical protein